MSYTDFNNYSHGTLRSMVQAMNSGEVMAASDPWRRAAETLKAIHTSLQSTSGEAAVDWEGTSSDAFYSKMTKLANSINNTASYAQDAAETLKHMAQAIDQAKKTMPEEPGLWDQFSDGFGDTVSATFGGDDEDTKTTITDEKKSQAVAVMQTLAMKYRAATPVLKPPTGGIDDSHEIAAPGDPTGAAIGGLIAGAGLGTVGSGSGSGAGGSVSRSSQPRSGSGSVAATPKAPRVTSPPAPVDPAIKGGSPQPAPKAPTPANVGPGTGIDGAVLAKPPTATGSGPANPGTPGGGGGSGPVGSGGFHGGTGQGGPAGFGTARGPQGSGAGNLAGGQNKAGVAGRELGRGGPGGGAARGGSAFGAGGMHEGGVGGGGRGAAARGGAGAARRAGGVAGESTAVGSGTGRKAFTEGGSGLGARSRVQGEHGAGTQGKGGQGMPLSDAQRRKKDRDKGSRRPDYLVEDEETWVSGQPSNPNVVE
ncbi:WXG100 family type VII secretion target [Kitasatospora sp. NPDC057015]|uniref:WXG100 family type VII secretion target n=1 Tax=Kitasatospora sp. NPDC057015 TaxID=3346001 RepID=UPI003642B5C2